MPPILEPDSSHLHQGRRRFPIVPILGLMLKVEIAVGANAGLSWSSTGDTPFETIVVRAVSHRVLYVAHPVMMPAASMSLSWK